MPFNPNVTETSSFYIDNYSVVQVPMMSQDDRFDMMEDVTLGAKVLRLPYREGVSMLILLPNEGIDYTAVDDEITANRFLTWIRHLRKMYVFHVERCRLLHSHGRLVFIQMFLWLFSRILCKSKAL